jgi:hypothetical protein
MTIYDTREGMRLLTKQPRQGHWNRYWHVFVPGVQPGADLRLSSSGTVRSCKWDAM